MKISVYNIYVLCLLMAIGAATLSGVILGNTFKAQQREREIAQHETGYGQLKAVQSVIENQLARMRTSGAAYRQEFLMKAFQFQPEDFRYDAVMDILDPMFFSSWVPHLKAEGQLLGFYIVLLYAVNSSKPNVDRNVQVWVDTLRNGDKMPMYAHTFNNGTETGMYEVIWSKDSPVATIGNLLYSYTMFSLFDGCYSENDLYMAAGPWASIDGNSYWYFEHRWPIKVFGIDGAISAQDTSLEWQNRLLQLRVTGSDFIIFDSNDRVLAATCNAEDQRLKNCGGRPDDGGSCINIPASKHPVAEIQTIFNAMVQPSWQNLSEPFSGMDVRRLRINGVDHIVIGHLLFSRDHLRLICIWYQPWTKETGNITGITTLVCALTILSTFLLTLLGIWGILRPMKKLGASVRTVTDNLKEGKTEASIQVAQSTPFKEVHSISKDFETIVVDFLGFSISVARDNHCAPKDATQPFAVVFTDIESSTRLWGKNPQAMSKCIQKHHAIIRSLIKVRGLYEVKTVGDSFMVVGTSPAAAIAFALDIQEQFWETNWEWDGIEELYKAAHCAEGVQATDRRLWNGIRVRIGVHYGSGDITYDEVSKGYDYYGNVVNMASRIESVGHGGQVLVSEMAFTAAMPGLDCTKMVVEDLGKVPLRGVTEAPTLLQLLPKSLCSRCFPSLRTDEDGDHTQTTTLKPRAPSVLSGYSTNVDHEETLEEFSQTHSLVRTGALPQWFVKRHLTAIYHFLDDLLLPLGAQQTSVLNAILKAWGIRVQPGSQMMTRNMLRLVCRMAEAPSAQERLRKTYDGTHQSLRVEFVDPHSPCLDDDNGETLAE